MYRNWHVLWRNGKILQVVWGEGDARNDNDDYDKAGHEKERVKGVGNNAEASNIT